MRLSVREFSRPPTTLRATAARRSADESPHHLGRWWDSFQAIEPYLNAPSPEVVNDAFEDAGLA